MRFSDTFAVHLVESKQLAKEMFTPMADLLKKVDENEESNSGLYDFFRDLANDATRYAKALRRDRAQWYLRIERGRIANNILVEADLQFKRGDMTEQMFAAIEDMCNRLTEMALCRVRGA